MKTLLKLCLSISFLSPMYVFAQADCTEIIASESIISMTDDTDYIWCGTEENGLMRIDKNTSDKTYWDDSNSEMKSNRIKSVIFYNDKLYLSSDSTLLVLIDNEIQIVNEELEGLLIESKDGHLMIAGRRDFYIMNSDEELTYHQVLTEVVFDQCCSQNTDIAIDADDNIWISHWDFYEYDVMKFDGNEWFVYDLNNSILPIESPGPNEITARGNKVFASNYSGVYQFVDNEWSFLHPNETEGIENEDENMEGLLTMTIENDSDNILWVAGDNTMISKTEKIAFQLDGYWRFITNEPNDFPSINVFKESNTNNSILYAGSLEGLITIDKSCLLPNIGVEEQAEMNDINLYPIPSKGEIHIDTDQDIERIELLDVNGKLLLQQSNDFGTIDIKHFHSGVYLLKIYSSNAVLTRSIIKE